MSEKQASQIALWLKLTFALLAIIGALIGAGGKYYVQQNQQAIQAIANKQAEFETWRLSHTQEMNLEPRVKIVETEVAELKKWKTGHDEFSTSEVIKIHKNLVKIAAKLGVEIID